MFGVVKYRVVCALVRIATLSLRPSERLQAQ